MAGMLKSWFRSLRMKKYSSTLPTGLIPLRSIRSAVVMLDGTEPDCLRYSAMMETFFSRCGISVSFIYLDLRKIGRKTMVHACGREVLNRCDVDWLGVPKGMSKNISGRKRKACLFSAETGLFVDLISPSCFTSRFISSAVRAEFKIGTDAYSGNPYDLIITDRADDAGDCSENLPGNDKVASGNACDTPVKIIAICNFLKQII